MTMLDRMRRHKNYLKWFLALVAVSLCLYLIPNFLDPSISTSGSATSGEVIASVGDRKVTVKDFDARYQAQLASYRSQFGASVNESLLRQLGIEQQVLRQLIEEQVAAIEAERQGIRVSDEELASQILAVPLFQENGQFIGDRAYRQVLQSLNPPLTVSEFEGDMRRSIELDRLRTALTDWMVVSDAELEREYKQRNEKIKLQVVALTAGAFRDTITVTDADVSAYFDAHKADYRVGERRKIRYFLMDLEKARLKVTVTPTEIQRDYNDNLERYHTPEQIKASHILLKTEGKSEAEVRTRAEGILKQLKGGADFAALAKQVSEDEATKEKGGDLDYFTRGKMVPEFENAAFAMQPGQLSDLVKSQYGFHIIKLIDHKPEVTRPLDEVRAEITERLTQQKASRQIADQASQLATTVRSAADLQRGANEAGATLETSELFTRDQPISGLGVAPQAADAAFRLKDMNEAAGPIDTQRGPVFMAMVERKDPYVPELKEVETRVREDLIRSRGTELSRKRGAEIAATLSGAKDFKAAAKALGFEAKETALISRGAPIPDVGVSADIDKVAFSLPVGGVSQPISTSDGTAIVKVTERDEATPEELKKDRETFRAELLNERRERFFSAYMNKARERTPIEVNNDVIRRTLNARGL
ncbi:MAG TPA: peptidyl-prolyl cis-trans isomerase [Vicinamibacterales bacterium]|nr:peptidyl-prolyl cis-trans isomerase [Vicinamibacterales bacterium]